MWVARLIHTCASFEFVDLAAEDRDTLQRASTLQHAAAHRNTIGASTLHRNLSTARGSLSEKRRKLCTLQTLQK